MKAKLDKDEVRFKNQDPVLLTQSNFEVLNHIQLLTFDNIHYIETSSEFRDYVADCLFPSPTIIQDVIQKFWFLGISGFLRKNFLIFVKLLNILQPLHQLFAQLGKLQLNIFFRKKTEVVVKNRQKLFANLIFHVGLDLLKDNLQISNYAIFLSFG